jgi:hypothetical protein
MNPLLDITGLNPSQDTPVELLHTILLGVIKYIWHHLNTNQWSNEDRHLLAIQLQSTDLTGLTVPPVSPPSLQFNLISRWDLYRCALGT